MNQNTWNRLSPEQQAAVRSMSPRFIKVVQSSNAIDGWAFSQKYSIQKMDGYFVISDGVTHLPTIFHEDRDVIEALYGDAIGNYGR